MSTKNLSGDCQQCGGRFEFPAEAAGLTGECPHCGQQTDCLLAAPPPEKSPVRAKAFIFTAAAVVILAGGLFGAFAALKRAQRMAAQRQELQATTNPQVAPTPADPFAEVNFRISTVTLEKSAGTSLVYAQGTIVNTTNRQRFGVKVELDLFDAAGKWVANASDYLGVIEPNAVWKFRALVVDKKAASAKIATIKETK